jgi:hypothetical protein
MVALTLDDSERAVGFTLPRTENDTARTVPGKGFQGLENCLGIFPMAGKKVFTHWKPERHSVSAGCLECIEKIPCGQTRTYGEIATTVGKPKAVRAVGSTCCRFLPEHSPMIAWKKRAAYFPILQGIMWTGRPTLFRQ